jgi:hypothetical protein
VVADESQGFVQFLALLLLLEQFVVAGVGLGDEVLATSGAGEVGVGVGGEEGHVVGDELVGLREGASVLRVPDELLADLVRLVVCARLHPQHEVLDLRVPSGHVADC